MCDYRYLFEVLEQTAGRDDIGPSDIDRVGIVAWRRNRFFRVRGWIVVMVPVGVRIVVIVMATVMMIAVVVRRVEVCPMIVAGRLTFVVEMAGARHLAQQERRNQQQA